MSNKTYNQLVNEVAPAVSPADKEFVALHRVRKYQAVNYPEHQFKGGTEKDHTKLSVPSDETGIETEAKNEKPKPLGEDWRVAISESAHIKDAMKAKMSGDMHGYHDHMAAHYGQEKLTGATQSYRDAAAEKYKEHDEAAKKLAAKKA